MTSKSFNSVTLSFDHFAPKGYKHRYVAMVSRDIYSNQLIICNLSFLDFDQPYRLEYFWQLSLQFRKVDEGRITPWEHQEQSEDDLRRSRPGDPPSIRINGLLPNTVYMARIAIYSNYSLRSFGKTSSTIEFKTEGIVSTYQLCQSIYDVIID